METNIKPEDFIKAASESSERTRMVIFLMVTASILIFIGFWNRSDKGWLSHRVQKAKYIKENIKDLTETTGQEMDWQLDWVDNPIAWKYAGGLVEKYGISGDKEAEELYNIRLAMQQEYSTLVKIPFFGFAIDEKDLGVLGGVTFIILLIVFKYSILRENANYQIVFERIKDQEKLKEAYDFLSMKQVFTVPHLEYKGNRILKNMPRLLILLPLLVYCITISDLSSIYEGFAFYPDRQVIYIAINTIFLITIVVFTFQGFISLKKLDQLWEKQKTYLPDSYKELESKLQTL